MYKKTIKFQFYFRPHKCFHDFFPFNSTFAFTFASTFASTFAFTFASTFTFAFAFISTFAPTTY